MSSKNRESLIMQALICFGLSFSTAAAPPQVGDPLPILSNHRLEGTLPSTTGKVVLVDFWASWCGPCRKAFPELETLHQTYRAKGLVVIGVSVDDKKSDMDKFLASHPVHFSVVRDAGKSLVGKLQPTTMPTSYLVDHQGNIRFVHQGFRGEKSVEELTQEIETLLKELP